MTAHDIMDRSRVFLNDKRARLFTDDTLLPLLQTAWDEMSELFEENGLGITNKSSSSPINVPAGTTEIGSVGNPALPDDLIEIQGLYERTAGSSEQFVPVTRFDFLNPASTTPVNSITVWAWQNQTIKFIEANSDREVIIDYIANVFPPILSANTAIRIINSKNALAYRTAGLAASNIGENPTRAEELNSYASGAAERVINIMTKGQQGIVTRRRPFRSNFKNRTAMY